MPGRPACGARAPRPTATSSFSSAWAFSDLALPAIGSGQPALGLVVVRHPLEVLLECRRRAWSYFFPLSSSAPWLNAERLRTLISVVSVAFAPTAAACPK